MAYIRRNPEPHPSQGKHVSHSVIERLEAGAIEPLVSLLVDHLLAQPIAQLVDPDIMAQQTVLTLKEILRTNDTEEWVRGQIKTLREHVPNGTARDHLPNEVLEPLHSVVSRPVSLNRDMVGRVIEHGAVEDLLRELLVNALQGFAQRLKPTIPNTGKTSSRLRSLKKVGEGMLGGLGAEIERQAEHKAKEFVDGILSSVVAQAADELCDPTKAESYGTFRGHILDQLLDTPLHDLAAEVDKVDPEALVGTTAATLRAISERESLEQEIAGIFRSALKSIENKSAEDLLNDAGIADTWRTDVEAQVSRVARTFIATPDFQDWLNDLLKA